MFAKFVALVKRIPEIAKAIVGGVGVTLTAVAALSDQLGITIIPVAWQPYITFGLAVLTALSIWRVPNADSPAVASDQFAADLRKQADQDSIDGQA